MEDLQGVVQEMKTSLEALKAHLQVNPDDHEAAQVCIVFGISPVPTLLPVPSA
jgi:hypothetical protein